MTIVSLSVPHRGDPTAHAWLNGRQQFISAMYEAAMRSDGEVFEKITAAEMATQWGLGKDAPREEFEDADATFILDLATKHGWDTPLYRADYYNGGDTAYSSEEIDQFEAAKAYAGYDESGHWVVETKADARDLIDHLRSEHAPRVGQCGPVAAANALEREIAKLEGLFE